MIALAVDLCNSVAVTLFGIALSAAFCNIHWTPKAKKRMLLYTLMIFCLSGIAYLGVDPGFGRYLYPLHTHLPLVLAQSRTPVAGDFCADGLPVLPGEQMGGAGGGQPYR